jgi:hypothetical protein
MSDHQHSPRHGADIEWTRHTSKSGKTFEVGMKKPAEGGLSGGGKQPMTKHDFGTTVNWPVGTSAWQDMDSHMQTTAALTRYALYRTSGLYAWELDFTNTEQYDYVFFDKTGDSYACGTWRNGDHYRWL